jgi:hypothetical protein
MQQGKTIVSCGRCRKKILHVCENAKKKNKAGGKNAKKGKSELVIFFSINVEKKPE